MTSLRLDPLTVWMIWAHYTADVCAKRSFNSDKNYRRRNILMVVASSVRRHSYVTSSVTSVVKS